MEQGIALRPYQVADLTFAIREKRCLFLHDPAGGKTPPVCVYAWYQWDTLGKRVLWVMPDQLMEKNRDELIRFTHFVAADIALVRGPKWRDALHSDAKVFILTADRLRISWEEIVSLHDFGALLADEIHMYWNTPESKRTRAAFEVAKRVPCFIGMTGTLIKGRLNSAYAPIHMIEPRYYPSYQAFLNYHSLADIYGKPMAWVRGERIAEIMGKHAIKRSFASIYGPEAKVIVTEPCQMATAQRAAYDEFEGKAILELADSFLEGATGGVYTLRCRQIMAHPHTFGLCQGEPTGKDAQLAVHLADHQNSGKPLVIYAAFVSEQERIAKQVLAAGLTYAVMNGQTPSNKRAQIDRDFREGRIQVIIGSPVVAAIGFNWEHCDHVLFTTMDYGDDTFYQAYRRFIRGMRKTPLLITVLEYVKSIDQRIFGIIKKKSELAMTVDGSKEVFELGAA